MKITTPAVYDLPEDQYHADPAPEPSLSSSVAKLLIGQSPRHAWTAHPKLNPAYEDDRDTKFDLGNAAHDALLRGAGPFDVIAAPDWRTKMAKTARDQSLAAKRKPILQKDWTAVLGMVKAAREQIAAHTEAADAFTHGKAEQTLIWREGTVWCRAMLDWLPDTVGATLYDYKTTGSANPDVWGARQLFDLGYDIQAAFYRRGYRAVLGVTPEFRFVVQENKPPFALSVVALSPGAMDMAERKVEAAIALWRRCMAEDRWPGYAGRIAYVEPPMWQETRWLEREDREQIARDRGEDLFKTAIAWQAPLNQGDAA